MNRTLLPRLFGERPERFGAALPLPPGESLRTGRNVFSIASGLAAGRGARGCAAPLRAVRLSRSGGNRQKERRQDSESGGNRIPMDEPRASGMM